MAYSIGQLRRDQISQYTIPLMSSFVLEDYTTDTGVVLFKDKAMNLSGGQVESEYSYYLRFKIKQLPDTAQIFTIRLEKTDQTVDNIQTLKTVTVEAGTTTTTVEFVFNPNSAYQKIIFQLTRTGSDYYIDAGDGYSGRVAEIKIEAYERIKNVIEDFLSSQYSGLTSLKKIGIQGPPGLIFVIDGEEIKIGRSGIYELYNDNIAITYIGFILKDSEITQGGKDYFIMDFKY